MADGHRIDLIGTLEEIKGAPRRRRPGSPSRSRRPSWPSRRPPGYAASSAAGGSATRSRWPARARPRREPGIWGSPRRWPKCPTPWPCSPGGSLMSGPPRCWSGRPRSSAWRTAGWSIRGCARCSIDTETGTVSEPGCSARPAPGRGRRPGPGRRARPTAAVRRAARAAGDRRVTIRPAPDTMTYLTTLLPVAQGVAAWASLSRPRAPRRPPATSAPSPS